MQKWNIRNKYQNLGYKLKNNSYIWDLARKAIGNRYFIGEKMNDINYEKYSQEYIKQYDNDEFERVLVAIRRKQVLKTLKKYKHNHILEVGCGLDPIFYYIEDYKTFTVVEPVKQFVENVRRLCDYKQKVDVLEGRIEDNYIQLLSKTFDFIIISSLLHEVSNPIKLMQFINKLCNNNTIVYIDVPNNKSFHRLLGLEMGIIKRLEEKSKLEIRFERKSSFNKQSIIKLIEDNGFEIINCSTFFIKPFSNEQMAFLMNNNIIDETVIRGLEKMINYVPEMGNNIAVEARLQTVVK